MRKTVPYLRLVRFAKNDTVALKPLTSLQRLLQLAKRLRYAVLFWQLRKKRKAELQAIKVKHLAQIRRDGKTIHETKDGWFVSFNNKDVS